jgi:hypothetical protein
MVNLNALSAVGRRTRMPEHSFHIRHKAYVIQPFMIAPVLPGETFKNYLLQSRVVSDPIKNPLIGWWIEYYVFYVKLRQLAGASTFEAMMLDAELDASGQNASAKVATYHGGSAPDFVQQCLDAVTNTYFREENASAHDIDNMPVASVNRTDWLDSVINDADFVGDIDVDVDGPDANTTIQASEVDKALRTWNLLRGQRLTEMDFEDYLATYGVRIQREDQIDEPELIRYHKNWTYPVNTVDPATGVPSSAVSWAVQERADKDRYFREPGFVFGVSVARPKVYLSNQKSAAVSMLTDAMAWLPAIMRDDPYTSLRKFAAGAGPLSANTDAYWVDVKDLFLYGDQFVNFALTETNAGLVALPTAALDKRYPTEAMIDALFVSGTADLIKQDGVCKLTVLGALKDTTPPISAAGV